MTTCLWFDRQAKEAFDFYATVFKDDISLKSENPMAVNYTLGGRRFMHLNGGPGFKINPSISFFYNASTEEELKNIWDKLSADSKILMPLNTYPWSPLYGWCEDKFGVNWQLMLQHDSITKVVPNIMFTKENVGKAKEAIKNFTSIFPKSETVFISTYEKGEGDIEGNVKYAQFLLNGLPYCAMESSGNHEFSFNEGVSFVVMVDTQEEIDYYWDHLGKNGQPGKCGWIKDQYGISWQVAPSIIAKLMSDPKTAPKATYAFLQMSKFIIADLIKATEE
jgi:predicted 3-demethylubiquinone-9 3-methyltransferase (glyoxalase superfamily)